MSDVITNNLLFIAHYKRVYIPDDDWSYILQFRKCLFYMVFFKYMTIILMEIHFFIETVRKC